VYEQKLGMPPVLRLVVPRSYPLAQALALLNAKTFQAEYVGSILYRSKQFQLSPI